MRIKIIYRTVDELTKSVFADKIFANAMHDITIKENAKSIRKNAILPVLTLILNYLSGENYGN